MAGHLVIVCSHGAQIASVGDPFLVHGYPGKALSDDLIGSPSAVALPMLDGCDLGAQL